jgi:hypothetical protein
LTAFFPPAYIGSIVESKRSSEQESSVADNQERGERRVVGFLGVGLDNKDGHQRLTKSEHFLLVGGSEETHERMQDTAVKFAQELQRRGKELHETPVDEVIEIFREAHE